MDAAADLREIDVVLKYISDKEYWANAKEDAQEMQSNQVVSSSQSTLGGIR